MSGQLFLRLMPGEDEAAATWLSVEKGQPGTPTRGALSEAAALAGAARVVVLVPGEEVLLTQLALPGRNRQRLVRAVPFALEEQLVDEVESLHFALGARRPDNLYPVAVVSRARMEGWLELLRGAGIQPDVLLPDFLALPQHPEAWTLLSDGERLMVRSGPAAGFVSDRFTASLLFERALADAGEAAPRRLVVFGSLPTELQVPDGLEVDTQPPPADLAQLLARHYDPAAEVNLLQGDYSRKEEFRKYLRPWYPAAAMLAIWVVAQLAMGIHGYVALSQESRALQARIETIYREAFPEAQRIVNPRAQMEHGLQELRRASGTGQGGVNEMLALVGPVLKETPGIALQTLRYRQGQLDIDLELQDLQTLDQLKQRLQAQASWQVDIQSAAARENRVQSRLSIRNLT